jgi:3-hydroxyacyl-CoA dehydrogenase/3-hydroxy-2-methylbutyryl-CoA dehydrogenase
MDLKGRSAIVTGGASGLGLAVVQKLQKRGAKVIVADVQRGENDLGGAEFVECNVTDEASVQAAVDAATKAGPMAALVCCAGIGGAAKILGREGPLGLDDFSRTIQVNLVGSFNAMRLAAWAMKDAPADEDGQRGAIVLTASIAAFEGQVGQAAYAASKGGLVGLTLPAARELARYGIRVVSLAPGIFDTPMLAKVPEKARAALAEGVPFPKRLGAPEEFGAMVMTILDSNMLNGTTVRLDGSLRMA